MAPNPSRAAAAPARRPATLAEARALAHPLRLRLLRLCLDEPRTNKELADLVGEAPATTLHHVRTLVRTGFLAPAEPRPGPRGSTEKPYVATGLSWHVDTSVEADRDPALAAESLLSVIDAVRAEVGEAGVGGVLSEYRLALRLPAAALDALVARLDELAAELAAEPRDPAGERAALYLVLHRR